MAYSKSNTTNVSFTDTSQSQTLSTKAKEVVLSATHDCYVSFDSTTVTSSNGFFVPANQPQIIHILFPAQISVIRETDDGVLSILELGDSMKELRVTYSGTYTSDVNLVGSIENSFLGDSNLKQELSDTFVSDSFLSITQNRTFVGDANLKREYDFLGNASLKQIISATFTGDSNLKETISALAFKSDATLVTN